MTAAVFMALSLSAGAQKPDAALDFSYYFDNREFDRGGEAYAESMTLFAARLTPYLGLRYDVDSRTTHRVMAGIDIYKNMGDGLKNSESFDEMSLFYEYSRSGMNDGRFQMIAGVLPRTFSEGSYSRLIFSDATLFTDHNIEGLLLKYRRDRLYGELLCDWIGRYGTVSRERFQINTAGEVELLRGLGLGWDGSLYHFACSEMEHYVVDNALAHLYANADLSELVPIRRLTLKTGLLTGYQRDRRQQLKTVPIGSESILTIGIRNFGFENTYVYAPDMMVYYDEFTSILYYGSPFYHMGSSRPQSYDRMELYWAKTLNSSLSMKISAVANFAEGLNGETLRYQGMQQRFSLIFHLGKLR